MGEHPNAALVRRAFAAFDTGDMETLGQITADDAVWHISGRGRYAGDYDGQSAVFGMLGQFMGELDSLRNKVHTIVADGKHVVALVNSIATRGTETLRARNVFVFHVQDEQATEVWVASFDQYESDEFFS